MIALSISPFLFVDDNHTCSIIDVINSLSNDNHGSKMDTEYV